MAQIVGKKSAEYGSIQFYHACKKLVDKIQICKKSIDKKEWCKKSIDKKEGCKNSIDW